ncbi:hypothetical protein TNCV_3197171 [Trichonephila clavipes]|nr:hypothetical protein TNCV_3197171 [Trichonephila clavipes]
MRLVRSVALVMNFQILGEMRFDSPIRREIVIQSHGRQLILINFKSVLQVDLALKRACHTPGLALPTTVAGKCPSSPEDEQDKQGENRDRDFGNAVTLRESLDQWGGTDKESAEELGSALADFKSRHNPDFSRGRQPKN